MNYIVKKCPAYVENDICCNRNVAYISCSENKYCVIKMLASMIKQRRDKHIYLRKRTGSDYKKQYYQGAIDEGTGILKQMVKMLDSKEV